MKTPDYLLAAVENRQLPGSSRPAASPSRRSIRLGAGCLASVLALLIGHANSLAQTSKTVTIQVSETTGIRRTEYPVSARVELPEPRWPISITSGCMPRMPMSRSVFDRITLGRRLRANAWHRFQRQRRTGRDADLCRRLRADHQPRRVGPARPHPRRRCRRHPGRQREVRQERRAAHRSPPTTAASSSARARTASRSRTPPAHDTTSPAPRD